MASFNEYICSLIGTRSTGNGISKKIVLDDPMIILPKLGKRGVIKEQFEPFKSFFYDLFNCDQFKPPPSTWCVDNSNCNAGQSCKQGSCVIDLANCVNAGCYDLGYKCNQQTGKCEFVPQCTGNSQCDMIGKGETCIANVCEKPPICAPGASDKICAPTWTCISDACQKADCSIIGSGNTITCCTDDQAFSINKDACCLFNVGDPRC